jgi:hypothetical protein
MNMEKTIKDVSKMTIAEMLEQGMSVTEISNAARTVRQQRIQENERKMKIEQARTKLMNAYGEYMTAITGEKMSPTDLIEFNKAVLRPLERTWNMFKSGKIDICECECGKTDCSCKDEDVVDRIIKILAK